MSEEEHPVDVPIRAKDHASGVFGKLTHSVERFSEKIEHSVEKLTEMGTALAGLGGAFGFERMVETGKESLDQIGKLSKLTGTSALNVAALRDVFHQSDLEAGQLGATITALSKKSLALEEGSKGLTKEAKRWGVELDKGPVQALISMSDAVKKHKIDAAGVAKLTRTSGENLGAMMSMLEEGPEHLKEMISHAEKLNEQLASPEALEQFEKFDSASKKIHEAWRRISEKVVVKLAPALSSLAEKLATKFDNIDVSKFIDPLVKGMQFVVRHAQLLGKIMLANSILMKTTGSGLTANAMKLPGIAGKIFGAGSRVGGMLGAPAALLSRGAANAGFGAGGVGALGTISSVMTTIGRLVGGITGIGLVAAAIYAVIKHLDVLKEKLGGVASSIYGAIKRLGDTLGALFAADAPLGRFARWVGDKLVTAIGYIGSVIEKIINMISAAIDEINDELVKLTGMGEYSTTRRNRESAEQWNEEKKNRAAALAEADKAFEKLGGNEGFNKLQGLVIRGMKTAATEQQYELFQAYKKMLEAGKAGGVTRGFGLDPQRMAAMEAAFGKKPELSESAAPKTGVYQDFRNSRFDIEQKFAEGFDPDRIAVAFANDIASMGEKRLTSGLTPVFSIR